MAARSDSRSPSLEGELLAGFPFVVVAGVDEVGRGCLFGPVVTAAVILPEDAAARLQTLVWLKNVKDSKLLSSAERERLFPEIQNFARGWSIAEASALEIDQRNIHQATLLAMARAVHGLVLMPDHILVDGKFPIPGLEKKCTPLVKGDQRSLSIACASILAKVYRDRLMIEWSARFPGYGFEVHKGYPTPDHLTALLRSGVTSEHRKSFAPVRDRLAAR